MVNFNGISNRSSKITEVKTSFRGPLIQYSIVKSIDRNKGTARRWIVFSNGKRSILVQYLFGKWLWDELNKIEWDVFWHLPEVTKDRTIYSALRARNSGVSKQLLRKRLSESPSFLSLKFISRQQYLTLKGRINWFFEEETITLRRVPKYSGYTKHYKDKGSLAPERDEVSVFLDPVLDISEEIIMHYLTVGEISIFAGDALIRPEEDQKVRNGKKRK